MNNFSLRALHSKRRRLGRTTIPFAVVLASICSMGISSSAAHALTNPPGEVGDGLVLWIDASNPNGDGSTPSEGSTISTWRDLSDAGNHAPADGTGATWESAPTGFNGNPALRFSRSSDLSGSVYRAALDIRPDSTPDLTVIALYLPVALSNANGVWGADNGQWDRFFIAYHPSFGNGTSDGVVGLGPALGGQTISGSGVTGGSPHLLSVAYSGNVENGVNSGAANGSYVYFNCVLNRVFTDSTHPTAAQSNFAIGRDGDDSQFDGYIAEMLVYDRVLSADELNAVSGYLATKYSLQSSCSALIQPEYDYSEFYDYVLPSQDLPNTGSGANLLGLAAGLLVVGIAIRARLSTRRKAHTM